MKRPNDSNSGGNDGGWFGNVRLGIEIAQRVAYLAQALREPALEQWLKWRGLPLIILGGPGVGKTELIRFIREESQLERGFQESYEKTQPGGENVGLLFPVIGEEQVGIMIPKDLSGDFIETWVAQARRRPTLKDVRAIRTPGDLQHLLSRLIWGNPRGIIFLVAPESEFCSVEEQQEMMLRFLREIDKAPNVKASLRVFMLAVNKIDIMNPVQIRDLQEAFNEGKRIITSDWDKYKITYMMEPISVLNNTNVWKMMGRVIDEIKGRT